MSTVSDDNDDDDDDDDDEEEEEEDDNTALCYNNKKKQLLLAASEAFATDSCHNRGEINREQGGLAEEGKGAERRWRRRRNKKEQG